MKEKALADKFRMQQLKLEKNLLAAVKQQRAQTKIATNPDANLQLDWVFALADMMSSHTNISSLRLRPLSLSLSISLCSFVLLLLLDNRKPLLCNFH